MIKKSVLHNQVTVVSQHLPHAPASAVGVWLQNGSRHQQPQQCGYAHLLEHLLFKGTQSMDASTLAVEFERMGGQVNAHTGREMTALHAFVPNQHVPRLISLFGEMLFQPRFDDHDLRIEKDVVLEEMAMVKDSPEEVLEERAIQNSWPSHPIAWPILGDVPQLKKADAQTLHEYLQSILCGRRIWIIAAGGISHDELRASVAECFGSVAEGDFPTQTAPEYRQHEDDLHYNSNRACFLWTFPAPRVGDSGYYTAVLANHLLGGGTSSRLFQEIREQRGLVYDIQSQLELYSDCGLWTISTACEPNNHQQLREAVETCIERLVHGKLTDHELAVSREFIKSNLVVERSNIEIAMERMAREVIYLGHAVSHDEHMAAFDRVTAADIQSLLRDNWALRSLDTLAPRRK